MSFHTNDSQQYSLTDITNSLTSREKKALENSWAKIFAEEIFPSIDEEREIFKVLNPNLNKKIYLTLASSYK